MSGASQGLSGSHESLANGGKHFVLQQGAVHPTSNGPCEMTTHYVKCSRSDRKISVMLASPAKSQTEIA